MNKTELVYAISEKSGLSKKFSEAALNATLLAIEDALKDGEKVVLVGFGTFEVRKRAERKGRNPQTSQEIQIPASQAPVFKAGKSLKDSINSAK
ncbi:MAG: HU family DNA-binding protein [Clostridiales bacterium]|jgi:DNA-binding protein HU-beta|nr:HU family DNA-binding protein [Clostridiales bacterium]